MSKDKMLQKSFYTVIGMKNRGYGDELKIIKTTQSAPDLKSNEIAVKIKLALPSALFTKPTLQANITIDNNKVTPSVVNAEVMENITEIIEKQLGIEMKINLVEPQMQQESAE